MKNNFVFRKATVKDLKNILRLNFKLFKREYKKFDKSLNLNWTYGKEGRKYFKDKLTNKNSFVEVVEYNDKIIGYLCGGISKRMFYRKKVKYAKLENMIIEKKFRGKRIGQKLTKNFINWCKKNKVNYISVTSSAQNQLALNFYRKSGFKDYNLTLEIKMTKRNK